MNKDGQKMVKLPFRIKDGEVSEIIRVARRRNNAEVKIVLAFPESPSQGGWQTRPVNRGGHDVFVTVMAPAQHETELMQLVSELKNQYA